MEGNTEIKQRSGCSLTHQFPFHSLPDKAYKAGERKADAGLEKSKTVFLSLSNRKHLNISLLLSSSWAFQSPCPGLSPLALAAFAGCPFRVSPRVPAVPGWLSPASAPAHGCQGERRPPWALSEHAGPGEERQPGRRDRCVRRWGDTQTQRLAASCETNLRTGLRRWQERPGTASYCPM